MSIRAILSRFSVGVFFLTLFFVFPISFARASEEHPPEVKIYSAGDLKLENTFYAFDRGFTGGVTTTVGDTDGDGLQEIIAAPARHGGPNVRSYNMNGSFAGFGHFVFPKDYRGGVSLAAGDVDGDGIDEVVVGQADEQARVKVYESDGRIISSFLAFPGNYKKGIRLAVGDVNGDGKKEIIVGTGYDSRTHIRVFDGYGKFIGISIYPFPEAYRGGLSMASADINNDGKDEIIVGAESNGAGQVLVFSPGGSMVSNFIAYPLSHRGGVRVAAGDVDGDGIPEILTSVGSKGGPQIRAFETNGQPKTFNIFSFPRDFTGGVYISIGNLDGDNTLDVVTTPASPFRGRKSIFVSIAEQRLYAYEGKDLINTFLISSGIHKYPSPTGDFQVNVKQPVKRYKYSYGPNHPDNYDLDNVRWNMNFNGPYWLHGTYWHHNFGRRMSHGCINMPNNQAEKMYRWAELGTPVIIR